VIVAVDDARGAEIARLGEDAPFVRYVEDALFPFLEAEAAKAREAEQRLADFREDLLERAGVSEDVAALRMRDLDLWILHPSSRFDEGFQGEEGVRQWRRICKLLEGLGTYVEDASYEAPALVQLVWDAERRAKEALRRAQERFEASE
jgi:hypothetical protein